ncbi:MAG: DUF4864 domain-containing protein [Planktomarina sp.]
MKSILLAAGLFVASFAPAFANEEDVQATIQNQINAFMADDFGKAFTYASPMIKGMFGGNPERFGAMVRNGYPMVHRPADVMFLESREVDGGFRQMVQIRDGNGNFHTLDYQVINSENGWVINGVQLIKAPSMGA